MFFCILFNYTILRDTKDVLMVTAYKSGAEVIPFIKTYCNLPAAIVSFLWKVLKERIEFEAWISHKIPSCHAQGFTGLYASMCDRMELKNVFYAIVIPFLIFFASFALFMYPARTLIHPHTFVDMLASHLPAGFAAPLSIVRNWSFALFYVMAEMWGSVVTSLLFWGFANEVTTVDEAKKYCKCNSDLIIFLPWMALWLTSVNNLVATNRSSLWYGSQCCPYLFGAIREMGVKDERDVSSWRRCLGREFAVFDGSRCWKWRCFACCLQIHAG